MTTTLNRRQATDHLVAMASAFQSPLVFAEKYSEGKWRRARHLEVIDYEFQLLLSDPTLDCLIVKCPVRHGKSEYLARWAPAWYMLTHPHNRVIITSNTQKLAKAHSRWVRDKVHELAPLVDLKGVDPGNSSASEWMLDGGGMGGCIAAGVGGSIVGYGADLLIIDDYLKDAKSAYSQAVRDAQWDWFISTSGTRLEPGGKIVLLCCLTGDSDVLRPDGTKTPLKDIKPGDSVASFSNGELVSSKVLNHASVGYDHVFRITLASGKQIRGNARHPFMVETEGRLEWIRLQNLTTDHRILTVNTPESRVRSMAARSPRIASESAGITTTKRGAMARLKSRIGGASGMERPAIGKGATSLLNAGVIATATTRKSGRLTGIKRRRSKIRNTTGSIICGGDMGLQNASLLTCSKSKTAVVLSAKKPPLRLETGTVDTCASITATKPERSEACYVTTAIPPLDTLRPVPPPINLLNTSVFSSDQIVSIERLGMEEVFDVEVAGTASFIANGMVTHNTAWHPEDLIGRILEHKAELDMRVRCVTLQALRDSSEGKDPLGRADGEALWPERWPADVLERRKRQSGQWWHSIYQGRPKGSGLASWPPEYFYNLFVEDDEWPTDLVYSASALDPSKGKSTRAGDYQAMVYAGYRGGKFWIDADLDRRSVTQMVRRYVEFNRERRPAVTAIEGNAFQELLSDDYIDACAAAGYRPDPPIMLNNTVNKNLRIERIGKFLASGLLRFRRCVGCELLIAQLKDFPNGKYDDGPDALEQVLRVLCMAFDELNGLNETLETVIG